MHDIRRYIKAFEAYQEPGGTFESNGLTYDINILFLATDTAPVAYFRVADLQWVVDENIHAHNVLDELVRVEAADVNVPILVTTYEDRWLVVDGWHRLLKALALGYEFLPGKFVSEELLESSLIQ